MRCSRLQSLAILHHRLDCIGVECSGETFVSRFDTLDNGHCHILFSKIGIEINHLYGASFRFLGCSMGTVAFLPQELGSAKEHACTHFPAHNVGPLVAQHRQITVAVNPVLISSPYNGFGSGTHDKLLLKTGIRIHYHAVAVRVVLQSIVSDNSTLLGETFNVLSLTA